MFNVQACAIAAALAFVVSLLMGLITGAYFPALILRPIIFAVVFFVLAAGINVVVSRYLPELLDGGGADVSGQAENFALPGENLNISEDDGAALPGIGAAVADEADDSVGDISAIDDRPEGDIPRFGPDGAGAQGLDQNTDSGYTEKGSAGFSDAGGGSSSHGSADILADLNDLANAYSASSLEGSAGAGGGGPESDGEFHSTSFLDAPVKKTSAGGKGQKIEWDFDPQKVAQGIRTKISKEG